MPKGNAQTGEGGPAQGKPRPPDDDDEGDLGEEEVERGESGGDEDTSSGYESRYCPPPRILSRNLLMPLVRDALSDQALFEEKVESESQAPLLYADVACKSSPPCSDSIQAAVTATSPLPPPEQVRSFSPSSCSSHARLPIVAIS